MLVPFTLLMQIRVLMSWHVDVLPLAFNLYMYINLQFHHVTIHPIPFSKINLKFQAHQYLDMKPLVIPSCLIDQSKILAEISKCVSFHDLNVPALA